jgi:hypothetical protein
MAVSDIQNHPREEKYIAIGYDGNDETRGALVIWDVGKRKAKRFYNTAAIASAVWSHTGDFLYAGSRLGGLICGGVEKENFCEAWNTEVERSEYADEATAGRPILIRRLLWLAPQAGSSDGCLFALLGAFGENTEHLKSVIVGLAASNPQGGLEQVLAVPPTYGDDVVGFRIVPSGHPILVVLYESTGHLIFLLSGQARV